MNMQTEEVLGSLHAWLTKQIASATKARNKTNKAHIHRRMMLQGKVKGLVDAINHVEVKWGKKLVHQPFPKRISGS